jgi:hypothetical protein
MRRATVAVGTLGAVLVLAGSVMAAPTVAITSPAAGTTIDRSDEPTFTVEGTASFDAPAPAVRKFYLRRVLDATQKVTGAIAVSSFQGLEGNAVGFSAGQVTIEITLSGRVDGASVILGSATKQYLVTPDKPTYTTPYDFELPQELDGGTVTDLNLAVKFSGPVLLHNFIALNGQSFVDVPYMDTGAVLIGIGSLTTNPSIFVPATVNEDGTFAATVNTPTTGQKRVFARAVQNGTTVSATPVQISVVA